MHRVTHLVLIALLVLALGGCGAPKPVNYYAVQMPPAPAPAASAYPIDLLVGRVSAPTLLETTPIVYRTGSNQLGTYQYHRWADPPVQMVQTKLVRLLRDSGQYRSVSGLGNPSDAQFVVRGRLSELAEVDAAESISGLVTMEFELYNRKTAKILWSHAYSQVEPVPSKDISAVVSALDRNLDRGLKEVVAGIGKYFAANPPATN